MSDKERSRFVRARPGHNLISLLRSFPVDVWAGVILAVATMAMFLCRNNIKGYCLKILALSLEQGVNDSQMIQNSATVFAVGIYMMAFSFLRQFYGFDMYTELSRRSTPEFPNALDMHEIFQYTMVVHDDLEEIFRSNLDNDTTVDTIHDKLTFVFSEYFTPALSSNTLVPGCRQNWQCDEETGLVMFSSNQMVVYYRYPFFGWRDEEMLFSIIQSNKHMYVMEESAVLRRCIGWTATRSWDWPYVNNIFGSLVQSGIFALIEERLSKYAIQRLSQKKPTDTSQVSPGSIRSTIMKLNSFKQSELGDDNTNANFQSVKVMDIGALWYLLSICYAVVWLTLLTEKIFAYIQNY